MDCDNMCKSVESVCLKTIGKREWRKSASRFDLSAKHNEVAISNTVMEKITKQEAWARFNAAKKHKAEVARRIIERMNSEHYAKTGVMLPDTDFEVW